MVGTWCPSANSDDVVFVALILHSLRGLELHIHTLCHVTLQFLQPQSGWHMLLHPVGDELGQMPCHCLCNVGSSGPVPLWSRDPRIHPCLSSASLCPCDLPWKDHAPGGHCAGILGPGMRHAEEMGTPLKAWVPARSTCVHSTFAKPRSACRPRHWKVGVCCDTPRRFRGHYVTENWLICQQR